MTSPKLPVLKRWVPVIKRNDAVMMEGITGQDIHYVLATDHEAALATQAREHGALRDAYQCATETNLLQRKEIEQRDGSQTYLKQRCAELTERAITAERELAEARAGRILSVGDAQVILDSVSMMESAAVLLPEHEIGLRCQAHLLRNLRLALAALPPAPSSDAV